VQTDFFLTVCKPFFDFGCLSVIYEIDQFFSGIKEMLVKRTFCGPSDDTSKHVFSLNDNYPKWF